MELRPPPHTSQFHGVRSVTPSMETTKDRSNRYHSTPFYSTSLHPTSLRFTPLHSTPLHSTPLYCISLHSTPGHSTPLHSTPGPELVQEVHTGFRADVAQRAFWCKRESVTLVVFMICCTSMCTIHVFIIQISTGSRNILASSFGLLVNLSFIITSNFNKTIVTPE